MYTPSINPMISLRSPPSTTLGGTIAEVGGVGFGTASRVRLTAPRPKRVVMPIVHYDSTSGSTFGSGGSSGPDGQNYTCSPYSNGGADYAGVFESGCDPVAVRASLKFPTPCSRRACAAAAPFDEAVANSPSCYGEGASDSGVDDDSSDCLFAMECAGNASNGPSSDGVYSNVGGEGLEGSSTECDGYSAYVNLKLEAATSGARRRARGVAEAVGGGNCGPRRCDARAALAGPGPTLLSQRSEKVNIKRGKLLPRASPRPKRQGMRCSVPGMYRLRLSASC